MRIHFEECVVILALLMLAVGFSARRRKAGWVAVAIAIATVTGVGLSLIAPHLPQLNPF